MPDFTLDDIRQALAGPSFARTPPSPLSQALAGGTFAPGAMSDRVYQNYAGGGDWSAAPTDQSYLQNPQPTVSQMQGIARPFQAERDLPWYRKVGNAAQGVIDATMVGPGGVVRAAEELPEEFVARAANGLEPDQIADVTRPGHFYRGMTSKEYDATLGSKKGVKSRNDYSLKGEGTSFASDAPTAESYVNFGRDDPRKTGNPNYLVEVAGGSHLKSKRDGYYHAEDEIPASLITRVWRMLGDDKGRIIAKRILSIGGLGAAGAAAASGMYPTEQPKKGPTPVAIMGVRG